MTSLEKTMSSLKEHGFNVCFVESVKEAKDSIVSAIPKGSVVGMGGSMTVEAVGVMPELAKTCTVIDQYEEGISREESVERRRKALTSDYFIAGCNAITENGELVNIDGFGNRVAAMIFGPKNVFLLAGRNKICGDTEAALRRIYSVAGPKNVERLNRKTPCASGGTCDKDNCWDDSICNTTVIMRQSPIKDRITVVIINEDLGY